MLANLKCLHIWKIIIDFKGVDFMKKTISIIISTLIIIMLTACSGVSQHQEEPPPVDNTYWFDSISELEAFLHSKSIQDREGNVLNNDAEIKERFGEKFSVFKKDFADGNNKLKVPHFAGNSEESKNKNEYESIMVLPKELYGFSWILYRLNIEDCNMIIRTAYMGNEFEEKAREMTFPELLKQIYPDAPNVHNSSDEKYSHYKAIYGCNMCIDGKSVSTLVCESKRNGRVYVFFAYEDMIVGIRGNDKLLSDGFLENLTFLAYTE